MSFHEEVIFADEVKAYRIIPSTSTVVNAMESIKRVQEQLHKWGASDRITFDSSKESKHISP